MNTLKEFLLESIQKTYVFEMAVSRKELKDKVDSLIYQIIENWCLVKHCTLYDSLNRNKNHWKKNCELICLIYIISSLKVEILLQNLN